MNLDRTLTLFDILPRDILFILSRDPDVISKICQVSSRINGAICSDENGLFWQQLYKERYGELLTNISKINNTKLSYKDKYIIAYGITEDRKYQVSNRAAERTNKNLFELLYHLSKNGLLELAVEYYNIFIKEAIRFYQPEDTRSAPDPANYGDIDVVIQTYKQALLAGSAAYYDSLDYYNYISGLDQDTRQVGLYARNNFSLMYANIINGKKYHLIAQIINLAHHHRVGFNYNIISNNIDYKISHINALLIELLNNKINRQHLFILAITGNNIDLFDKLDPFANLSVLAKISSYAYHAGKHNRLEFIEELNNYYNKYLKIIIESTNHQQMSGLDDPNDDEYQAIQIKRNIIYSAAMLGAMKKGHIDLSLDLYNRKYQLDQGKNILIVNLLDNHPITLPDKGIKLIEQILYTIILSGNVELLKLYTYDLEIVNPDLDHINLYIRASILSKSLEMMKFFINEYLSRYNNVVEQYLIYDLAFIYIYSTDKQFEYLYYKIYYNSTLDDIISSDVDDTIISLDNVVKRRLFIKSGINILTKDIDKQSDQIINDMNLRDTIVNDYTNITMHVPKEGKNASMFKNRLLLNILGFTGPMNELFFNPSLRKIGLLMLYLSLIAKDTNLLNSLINEGIGNVIDNSSFDVIVDYFFTNPPNYNFDMLLSLSTIDPYRD